MREYNSQRTLQRPNWTKSKQLRKKTAGRRQTSWSTQRWKKPGVTGEGSCNTYTLTWMMKRIFT